MKHKKIKFALYLAAQLIVLKPTFAEETITLDEVVVSAKTNDLLGIASTASEGTVTAQDLENRPLLRPAEVMEAVPGLIVSQHSGDGKEIGRAHV